MITINNIASHELIGLNAEIVWSSNAEIVGMNGTIIDETKSMITMDTAGGARSIQKRCNGWRFFLEEGDVVIDGSRIAKRPSDRLGVMA